MVLDTNAYSALARGLPQIVQIVANTFALNIPLPVIAELRYGFKKGSKPEFNENNLQKFLAQPQISILNPTIQTTVFYSDIQLLCSQKGKALSQNDIWIAALSCESGDTLVTFDQDFRVLKQIFENKLIILEL